MDYHRLKLWFPAVREISIFTVASRPALGLTPWVTGARSPAAKELMYQAHSSPASGAGVSNAWSYSSAPLYVLLEYCIYILARGHFYLNHIPERNV